MAKYVQNPAKAGTLTHIHQRSDTMYEVTNNQKGRFYFYQSFTFYTDGAQRK